MQRRHFHAAVAGSVVLGLAPTLRAQVWPDKPVRWVLSQPPGSGPDNVARILSDRLARAWGQAVVIENNVAEYVLSKAKVTDKTLSFEELMGQA